MHWNWLICLHRQHGVLSDDDVFAGQVFNGFRFSYFSCWLILTSSPRWNWRWAMTSIVDSKAHLAKRCADMGMSERAIAQLTLNNLDTMGKVAFSIGQPRQPLDNAEFNEYARNTLGAMMSQADAAVLKRLVFEGHTLVLGQLRELVTDPNAALSRKLPAVEREHRMEELRQRLSGVVVERQLEPSHELLEAVMQQKESNQLTYIQMERCTSREWEITMGKSKKQLSLDSEKLIVKERSDIPDQFHSSELQALRHCVEGEWPWLLQISSLGRHMNGTCSNWPHICGSTRRQDTPGQRCSRSSKLTVRCLCIW